MRNLRERLLHQAYRPRHHHPVHRPGLTVQKVHLPVQSLTAPRRDRLVQALKLSFPTTGIGTQITTELKAKEGYKIACIVKNSTNPYMVGCINGVKKAAEDMGFEAITMAPSTNDSVEEQVKIMEDLIETGVDGFVLVPVDSNGIMPGVRKAEEAGIPVVCIGTPAAEETFLRTGVDYTETGRLLPKELPEQLEGKGTSSFLRGLPERRMP